MITRASKEPAGLDLYSNINIDIEVGSIKKLIIIYISYKKLLRIYNR